MKSIKLALKNITKLNKFIFIFVNLYPWVLGSTNGVDFPFNSEIDASLLVKKDDKPDDEEAYQAFLKFAETQKEIDGLHLFFFDVGHGNFILVRDKSNAIVVDAGGNKTANITAYIQKLFETCLGEANLSQTIITHNHEDHKNYVEDVDKWQYDRLPPLTMPDYKINGVKISFLQPLTKIEVKTDKDKNHVSSVFVLTYQGIKILFTGDATGLSLDNYVEKHQKSNDAIVDTNRALLKNIHLFVMPHHGSSTEDSFRWTLYVTKHSPNLLASVICGDPFADKYKDVRNWVRDISWPDSMKNKEINNFIYYWSARSEVHKKQTKTALFITGAEPCRCVYFKIQNKQLYKYDSTRKDFVHLNGEYNQTLQEKEEDSYDAGEKVMQMEDTMEEDETTTGEMQMDVSGFSMRRNTQKMEEVDIFGISHVDEQTEMKEKKSMSEDSKDEKGENEMKENSGMSATFPSNVYKIQDAFDDDNDYMAYAS